MKAPKNFKSKVIKGGIFLTLRQLLSAGLALISTLVIARVLGPKNYGIVATSIGIYYFFKWLIRLGMDAYLICQPDLSDKDVNQIVAFYNTAGILMCLVLWLTTPAFGWWTGNGEITRLLQWLMPLLWVDMIGGVSTAMLERDLRFDLIGIIDAVAQIFNYLISVPIILIWQSYWGPIVGMAFQVLLTTGIAYYFYRFSWGWQWNWKDLKPALAYGISFFCANWFFTLKGLTIPLIISRLAGIEAVGIASFALRLVERLSLIRDVMGRMSISVMSKLINDPEALRRSLSRGMAYLCLMMSITCALFACVASWIVPIAVGEKWLVSTQIFSLLAISASVTTVFDLHKATLHAAGHNNAVGILYLAYVGLLWLCCWIFIPLIGLWGYGIAELLALPSYYLIHRSLVKFCGSPNYWSAFWIVLAACPVLISTIWLPPLPSFGLLVISFGLLFAFNASVRSLPRELLSFARS